MSRCLWWMLGMFSTSSLLCRGQVFRRLKRLFKGPKPPVAQQRDDASCDIGTHVFVLCMHVCVVSKIEAPHMVLVSINKNPNHFYSLSTFFQNKNLIEHMVFVSLAIQPTISPRKSLAARYVRVSFDAHCGHVFPKAEQLQFWF